MDKKLKITKELCRKVQIMLAGGATMKEIGELLGISKATVSRIKIAGFNPEEYQKLTRERAEKEKAKQEAPAEEQPEECPGQISMDELEPIPEVEWKESATPITDLINQVVEKTAEEAMNKAPANADQVKLIRFLAGRFDSLEHEIAMVVKAVEKITERQEMTIFQKLDCINNNLAQLVRLTGPERVGK